MAVPRTEAAFLATQARGLATVVSYLASPPVSAVAVLILAGDLAADGYRWVVVYAGLAVALPLTYLLLLRQRGDVSDLEVVQRHQRLRPYAFATLAGLLGVIVLALGHASPWIFRVACGMAANTLLVWLITQRWKVSFHCSSLAYLGAVFWLARAESTLLVAGLVLMIWARVVLQRHTLAQAMAGATLGIALGFLVTA